MTLEWGDLIYDHLDGEFIENAHISGIGGIIKRGDDTLILMANNTYTGLTLVDCGSLQIGNNGTSGSIAADVLIQSGTRLIFNRSDNLTYDGQISGEGDVIKEGMGTLVLNGINTYTGTTYVNTGTLLVGGDEENSDAQIIEDIVVMPGATLGGHGYFDGNIVNDGSLAPAASIGTTWIHGNYTQNLMATSLSNSTHRGAVIYYRWIKK